MVPLRRLEKATNRTPLSQPLSAGLLPDKLPNRARSGRGPPHSQMLSRFAAPWALRKVLECGCPLPLFCCVSLQVPTCTLAPAKVKRRQDAKAACGGRMKREVTVAEARLDLPQPR
jgi:hypothetical protein